VQAANGGLSSTEQSYLDTEHSKLASALDDAVNQAKFGNTDLVSGTASTTVTVQSGADAADRTDIVIDSLSADTLNMTAGNVSLHGFETVEFVGPTVSSTNNASNDVWTINVGNVAYSTQGSENIDTLDELVTALNLADTNGGTAGGTTLASAGWVITKDGSNIIATSTSASDQTDGTPSLTYAGSSSSASAGSASVIQTGGTFGIAEIDSALDTVASDRATLGAMQAQLESMVRNLSNVAENTAAAAGRIMDTDYAAETANLTKAQILQQAATSILAQANAQPQAVLSLLQ
jgi:flagellin